MARATKEGRPAVLIDTPLLPLDLDKQLSALLVEELYLNGATALAEAAGRQSSFSSALREVLRQGALVVLDEFQRSLDSSARPPETLAAALRGIATRTPDPGSYRADKSTRYGQNLSSP
jgi:hypothetical protein